MKNSICFLLVACALSAASVVRADDRKLERDRQAIADRQRRACAERLRDEEQEARRNAQTRMASETDAPKFRRRMDCFTGGMRVSTPHGFKEIAALSRGELIWSFDPTNGRYTANRVHSIRSSVVEESGVLCDRAVPIEVTARQRFYAVETKDYRAIESLDPDHGLLGYYPLSVGRLERPAPIRMSRGPYLVSKKPVEVFEIELEDAPHTYFVEGVLVHNSKSSI